MKEKFVESVDAHYEASTEFNSYVRVLLQEEKVHSVKTRCEGASDLDL